MINLDETHHKKSSEGEKGGSRSTTLTNPALPRAGSKFAKDDGNHVSACYGATPLEPMPPVMIYNSGAKDLNKMKVRPTWAVNLPVVTGRWGFNETTSMDTQVSARHKGSMEEDLWIRTCLLYLSLYPNVAPRFEWDGDVLIKGPIMIKTDSGPGRQCKSERSIKFCADMHQLGLHMMPGLPNSTSATQEMDDAYQTFKSATDKKSQKVFTRKIYCRAKAVEQHQLDDTVVIPVSHLTNDDIPEIINGKPGDPIEERPFDNKFTSERILKSFLNIGWTPFTRKALEHKKVRHMLGEGGASEEMKGTLESVQERYDSLRTKVTDSGINGFVFNAHIPVHKKHPITQKLEDEQVKELVDNKKAFSAGGQWATLGLQLMGSTAIIRAQKMQLERDEAGGRASAAKKLAGQIDKINKAQAALLMFRSNTKMGKPEWSDVIKFLWPRYDEKAAPSKLTSIIKIKAKLQELETKYGKTWDLLMEQELPKARAENVAENEAQIDDEVDPEIEGDADSVVDPEEEGTEEAV